MDIYIKPVKKISVADRDKVFVKDFCEVIAADDVSDRVKDMKILDITQQEKKSYLISVTEIIKAIKKKYPDYVVSNVGEIETLVDYRPQKTVDNKFWEWTKIIFVSLVLLIGSSTAIMSFHADAQLPEVFKKMYEIFMGRETDKPLLVDIPYSIGLGLGIIVFFNHFAGKKISGDPTPIEVQMSIYDEEVTDTMIDVLDAAKYKKDGGGGQ